MQNVLDKNYISSTVLRKEDKERKTDKASLTFSVRQNPEVEFPEYVHVPVYKDVNSHK